MSYQDEDELPCIHHRSQFDTLPAPAMDEYVTRIHAPVSEPEFAAPGYITTLRFEGGNAEIRKPTREELLLSAKQWATSIREQLQDNGSLNTDISGRCSLSPREADALLSKFERLEAVLAELAALPSIDPDDAHWHSTGNVSP